MGLAIGLLFHRYSVSPRPTAKHIAKCLPSPRKTARSAISASPNMHDAARARQGVSPMKAPVVRPGEKQSRASESMEHPPYLAVRLLGGHARILPNRAQCPRPSGLDVWISEKFRAADWDGCGGGIFLILHVVTGRTGCVRFVRIVWILGQRGFRLPAPGSRLPASGVELAALACGSAASGSLGFGFWLGNGVGLDGPALGELGFGKSKLFEPVESCVAWFRPVTYGNPPIA